MPLVVAPFVALSIGIAIGLRRAGSLGASGVEVANRCVALLAALAFFPSVAFAVLYKPGWAWMHIGAAGRLPSFMNLSIAAAIAALLVVGHRAGQIVGQRPGRATIAAAAIPAAFALALVVGLFHRVGVLEPARRGAEAIPLGGSRFAAGLALLDLLLGAAVWLTIRRIDDLDAAPRDLAGPRLSTAFRSKRTNHG